MYYEGIINKMEGMLKDIKAYTEKKPLRHYQLEELKEISRWINMLSWDLYQRKPRYIKPRCTVGEFDELPF